MNYELKNNFLKIKIKSFGAELNSLQKCNENIEYLWQADTKYWNRHAPILFPIVGRLKYDSYFYDNKKYSMSQHGFARDNEFKVIQREDDFIKFQLKQTKESLEIYPFLFELNITYKLEKSKLIIFYEVKNNSENQMFFSIGAHPAFNWPLNNNEEKEDYFLELKNLKNTTRYFLNDKGLVYKNSNLNLDGNKLYLSEELFKEDALVFNDVKINQLTLKNIKNDRFIKIKFENFHYLGIW